MCLQYEKNLTTTYCTVPTLIFFHEINVKFYMNITQEPSARLRQNRFQLNRWVKAHKCRS